MTNSSSSDSQAKTSNVKIWLVSGGVALGLIVMLVIGLQLKFAAAERAIQEMQRSAANASTNPSIGKQWQWDRFPKEAITDSLQKNARQERERKMLDGADDGEEVTEEVPDIEFDVVDIYRGLSNVELDEGGNVVLDSKARESLEDAFSGLPENMSEEDLHELQELVKIGLPGEAGYQTADILGRYYYYRLAQKDLPNLHATNPSLETALEEYDRLKALRYNYFGQEAAEKLYGEEHVMASYTIRAMEIESNRELSVEEKQQQLQALRKETAYLEEENEQELPPEEIDANNAFKAKYSAFSAERAAIEQAGLSAEQRRAEIDTLLAKYFAEDEMELFFRYDAIH